MAASILSTFPISVDISKPPVTQGSPLRLTFDFNKNDIDTPEIEERRKFWDSPETSQWFKDRGYTLYRRVLNDYGDFTSRTVPSLPFGEFQEAKYPYAYHDAQKVRVEITPLCAFDFVGKVAFAQDSLNRHVVIKIVPDDSYEYRILRFLSKQSLDVLKKNCIIPVLELLPIEGFWFAIMPRWGSAITFPPLEKAYEVLDVMHAMLKGLAFLHEHNISHGDIRSANVVVNHFADSMIFEGNKVRPTLRGKRFLSYAIIDFDYSIMLPPEEDHMAFRLPYRRSWGTFNCTMDTAQGEFDFNPFVLDVGALGVEFCMSFQHLCCQLPFLAPLLDGMTTRKLKKRFKASEALQFFEQMYSQLTEAELQQAIAGQFPGNPVRYYKYDRWASVPPEFATKWASYREPPIPWTTKVLRRLCERAWVYHLVAHIRWFSFKLHSSLRSLFFPGGNS